MGRRRYRPRPVRALVLLTAWVVLAGGTWIYLVHREQLAGRQASCPAASTAQTVVSYANLEQFAPLPPRVVEVRVLNATGRPGLADRVAADLRLEGFAMAGVLGNDLLYPRAIMRCVGQIRFGPAGAKAAHTLSLVVPCAQLVRDERPGSTVDLALGTAFSTLTPNQTARTLLEQLDTPAPDQPQPPGAQQAIAATASPSLVAAAHETRC